MKDTLAILVVILLILFFVFLVGCVIFCIPWFIGFAIASIFTFHWTILATWAVGAGILLVLGNI